MSKHCLHLTHITFSLPTAGAVCGTKNVGIFREIVLIIKRNSEVHGCYLVYLRSSIFNRRNSIRPAAIY